jgi:glycosyltransferase involved in cell wall biosynthesis
MKVLIIHNEYRIPGGEDVVADREAELLRSRGHHVTRYTRSNAEHDDDGLLGRAVTPIQAVWSRRAHAELTELLRADRPDVVHVHNTHLVISPAALHACDAAGVPVVQSLHNPRLICPAATFFRNDEVCTDCLGKRFAYPGIVHACYRGSRLQTAMAAAVSSIHRGLKTWRDRVDLYVTFTDFYRDLFVGFGLPAEKIVVKPHFVAPDPGAAAAVDDGYVLFVGRLQPEKGVETLLEAWRTLPDVPLKVCGTGPLDGSLTAAIAAGRLGDVELLGQQDRAEVFRLIKGARLVVWPSLGYSETFGLVAIEAYACGRPVIASRVGVMAEIVEDGVTGLHFDAGDPVDLAAKVRWAVDHPAELQRMGSTARERFEQRYTADANYGMLMDVYERAGHSRRATA